jgi:hypothetical protein
MNLQVCEKRREVRRAADGAVHVSYSDPHAQEIQGRLLDVSASGFRMAHGCASLSAGQLVEFSHSDVNGRARVIWTRVVGERVETGFLVAAQP